MYGTIFRMKVKPGQEQNLTKLFEDWEKDRQPKVKGVIGGLIMKPDRAIGELIGVAIFEDRAAYQANADNPEQDAWYRKLRALLTDDPVWEDGEYVAGSIG